MENNSGNNRENFKVTGDWAAQSKQLKETYTQLSDADLKLEPGRDNEMLSRVESRLSKNRDEVIEIIRKTRSSSTKN